MGGGGGGGYAALLGSVISHGSQASEASKAARATKKGAEIQAEAQKEINLENIAAQKEAQDKSIRFQREQQEKALEQIAPWREAGTRALGTLEEKMAAGPGEFRPEEMPGYEYGYKKFVEDPLMSKAAVTGDVRSGSIQKALAKEAQDYASTQYDNFLNRFYTSLQPFQATAGLAQTAGQTGAGVASQMGAQGGNILSQYTPRKTPDLSSAYSAEAAGHLARGKIWGQGITDITQNILPYMMNYKQQQRMPVQQQQQIPVQEQPPTSNYTVA